MMQSIHKEINDGPITVNLLARAISNGMSRQSKKMSDQEAYEIAFHVLNFFGYTNYVIDNMLEPEDRDTFYLLEDIGVLDTEREETTLFDGREWRIHYWMLKPENVRKLAQMERKDQVDDRPMESKVYDELPEEIWRSRS
jgi:hypothetical protein